MDTHRKKDVILKNIRDLRKRQNLISEESEISISQLASTFDVDFKSKSIQEIYRNFGDSLGSDLTLKSKIDFLKHLYAINPKEMKSHISFYFMSDIIPGSHGKIGFVKNSYNNRAYLKFSLFIPHAKSINYANFDECVDAVVSGNCEFAIIPVENTSDGKMFGFYSLIDRYDLKICAVCNIDSDDSSKSIRYALIGRSYYSDKFEKINGNEKIFEFSVILSHDNSVTDLMYATDLCCANICRISSIPLLYDDTKTKFYFSVSLSKNTFTDEFLIFLLLEFPQHNPIGIYREIQ